MKFPASIATTPALSTKAFGCPAASPAGLKMRTFTVRSEPAPPIRMAAAAVSPAGALAQSISTQMRASSSIRPDVWLSLTQGASADAIQANGVVPVLKMSRKCFARVAASNSGSVSGFDSAGAPHFAVCAAYSGRPRAGRSAMAATCPSTATPIAPPTTGVTAAVTGISKTASRRGSADIMPRHLPCANRL